MFIVRRIIPKLIFLLLLSACSDSGDDNKSSFKLSLLESTVKLIQGESTNIVVNLEKQNGFDASVQLELTGNTNGITAGFSPNPTSDSSTLALSIDALANLGERTLTVKGNGGGKEATANITLIIEKASNNAGSFSLGLEPTTIGVTQGKTANITVNIVKQNGFSAPVQLELTGDTDGITASFSPNSTSTSSTLTLNVSATASVGERKLTVKGSGGGKEATTNITLTIEEASNSMEDFSLELEPNTIGVTQGKTANITVNIAKQNGFSAPVQFELTGDANGITASFSPNPTNDSSTLTLNVSASASTGERTLTIKGTSGNQSKEVNLSLNVLKEGPSTFKPAEKPSGIKLKLDSLFYESGQLLTLVLDFGNITPPDDVHEVVLSASESGDVERVALKKEAQGRYTSEKPIAVEAISGDVKAVDGIFTPKAGEAFYALYFLDKTANSLSKLEEDVIFDFALFEGGNLNQAPVKVDANIALTDDEINAHKDARAVGTLATKDGIVQIATEEVMLYTNSDETLKAFLEETSGVVIGVQEGQGDEENIYLIKVDSSKLSTSATNGISLLAQLAQLRSLHEEEGELVASQQSTLEMYHFVLYQRLEGYKVTVNPRMQYQGAPAISIIETININHTMRMVGQPGAGFCIPNDPTRPCVENVPAVWAFNALWDKDTERINVAVLDMGFAANDDFRAPTTGPMIECDMTRSGSPACGPSRAQGSPTVGNSFFGGRSWHGTGVVTTIGGVVNNNFGATGVGGQVVVPMLYKYDLAAYAFDIGAGIRRAVNDGASCINISASYPCRILTNVGVAFDICSPGGRAGICAILTAGAHAAAATVCATTGWIPFVGAVACATAIGTAVSVTAACISTLALGDVRSPMARSINYATQLGVPVVSVAGNALRSGGLPEVVRDIVDLSDQRTESWGLIPSVLPNVITVGAVNDSLNNAQFFGDRVDIWAPIESAYMSPVDINDISSSVIKDDIGGTSAAAPFITGLIANMQAVNPDLNPRTPGLSNAQRGRIVSQIRDILTDDANSFSNAELVSLGFSNQPVERRKLVNPLLVIQAAAGNDIPDVASLGYDQSLNFSELITPNDTQAQAQTLSYNETATGTILSFKAEGDVIPTKDVDWYKFTMPTSSGRVYEALVTLEFPTDPNNDSVFIRGERFSLVSRRGTTAIYKVLAESGSELAFTVEASEGNDNVYKVTLGTPSLVDPTVEITEPVLSSTLCENQAITFRAAVNYPDESLNVNPSNIVWRNLSASTTLGTGKTISINLSQGTHTIEVRVFGSASLTDTFVATIQDCLGTPPEAIITTPNEDISISGFDGFDDSRNQWYKDVTLIATATDAEDGTLTGNSLVWTTDRADLQSATLGTGNNLVTRLYSDSCFGSQHGITLTVEDSNGNVTSSAPRRIFISTVC